MNNNNNNVTGGVSFFGLLLVVFIALKVANVITWPWSIVLIPLWIELAFTIIAIIMLIIIDYNNRNRWRF